MQITGAGVLELVKALPELRFLDLHYCANLGDDFVAEQPKVATINFLVVRALTTGSAELPIFSQLQYVIDKDDGLHYLVPTLSASLLCHR